MDVDENILNRDMDIIIPESQLKRVDRNDNFYRDYRKGVKRLREKVFSINLPDGWIETSFVLRGQYRTSVGLELTISRDVLGFLYDLSKGFTELDFAVAITLHSKYAQRFYEWCCRWRDIGKFSMTPDELREKLELTQETKWLKQFVLDVAVRSIKELYDEGTSDLYFEYTEDRKGRGRGGRVQKWHFVVRTRERKPVRDAQNDDVIFLMGVLKQVYSDQKAHYDRTMNFIMEQERPQIKAISDRIRVLIDKQSTNRKINLGGYIRHLLREDYGFEEPTEQPPVSVNDNPRRLSDIMKNGRS
ncbi:replication initiator protein [Larkinella arboricola]|uniref:Replication initiator protein n=2 Tax=Larkinella arboricola TaxID=643671 RepID=A0A327WF00_LARAB|nr:replication initiator protein [Larkinella arboricola]